MKIRAIATLLFILFSISAFGQGRAKISGYIRDADGNPLTWSKSGSRTR